MLKFLVLSAIACTLCAAFPSLIAEDEQGQEFLVIPLSRAKRQTTYDISKGPAGTRVQLGHQGTLYSDGTHALVGGASASKTFNPNGPLSYGGNVGYRHEPSGSGIGIGAQKTKGFGTDVGVEGKYNIWRNGGARLDAVGSYGRHYGGPGGTGKPNGYGGVELSIPLH